MSESTAAANTRRYVEMASVEGEGEYGFRFTARLSVRNDAKRFKGEASGFQWRGQQGGVERNEWYMDEQDARQYWDDNFASRHDESFDERVAQVLKQ